ncbi:Nuclear transport factor 2 [Spiromyces aspiralis]|uniref:Nuclear transport factor 2 n=1 Tax=Spiromyces aspiralis TaxID=68401 RepID=A0ACC1HJ81_9FUNG|nr:Nuclear transport factor 2 [Spiromyces aspiralis]
MNAAQIDEQATKIAQEFANYYYNLFDNNRPALASLYRPTSVMTFETGTFKGDNTILEKLNNLGFQRVVHKVSTSDAHALDPSLNNLLLLITGQLLVDNESNPQYFAQTFILTRDTNGYFIAQDIFRLNYS